MKCLSQNLLQSSSNHHWEPKRVKICNLTKKCVCVCPWWGLFDVAQHILTQFNVGHTQVRYISSTNLENSHTRVFLEQLRYDHLFFQLEEEFHKLESYWLLRDLMLLINFIFSSCWTSLLEIWGVFCLELPLAAKCLKKLSYCHNC